MRWLSRLITAAIFAVVAVGVVLLFRSKMPTQTVGQAFKTWVTFRDGSRLAVGSPVVIAGVRIGDITDMSITGGLARVDMRLQDNIQIPADTWATRRADSLFGDSYIELIPTNSEEGAVRERLLRSGEPITHVEEGGSTDRVLRTMGAALPKIDLTLDSTHDTIEGARQWINGTFADGIAAANNFATSGRIDQPITRMQTAMTTVEGFTDRAADAVANADVDMNKTFDKVDRGVTKARAKMKDVRAGLHDGLANARAGMDKVDEPIEKLTEVVAAVNEGRGTDAKAKFGRLVNDPALGAEIAEVSEDGASATASLQKLRSFLGLRIEYNVFSAAPRFYATAELRAHNDKFFLFELEKGPLGGLPADQLAGVAGTNNYVRDVVISDQLRFTAQIGKQFGPLALRGGIKDSTFGAGADVYLFDNRLKLSVDAFGGFTDAPRLKLTAAYAVFRSIYLIAGIDDALTSPGYLPIAMSATQPNVPTEFNELRYGRDYFLGATLHFDDDDLTGLLRAYGAMIAGLL